jgi:hypothetical protein
MHITCKNTGDDNRSIFIGFRGNRIDRSRYSWEIYISIIRSNLLRETALILPNRMRIL